MIAGLYLCCYTIGMSLLSYTGATAYATKGNIGHPGSSAQITADEAKATAELNARLTPITVSGVDIVPAR